MSEINSLKRHKIELQDSRKQRGSKVFSPFRVIGKITNEVPYAIGTLGRTFYIATSIGKSFQIYDCSNLHLLFISEHELEFKISCLATHFQHLYVGHGNKVGIYQRGKEERLVNLTDNNRCVQCMCVFGDYLCIGADNNTVYVYKKAETSAKYASEFYTSFKIGKLLGGEIVSIIHLPTYLNKIVVVTKSNFVIYNVRIGKLVYASDEFPGQITTAESAPALDIMAFGFATGEVMLYNVKKGRRVSTIRTPFIVSSLSFRTDGFAHIAVGSSNGDLMFYDLDRQTRIHVLKGIHSESHGGISKVCFMNGQPIVITAGGDNQLKEFAFDPSLAQLYDQAVVQPPRLLRSRGGHSQSISCITFADGQGHFILSASKDKSLRGFSLFKDAQSYELSQRSYKNKDGSRLASNIMKEKFSEIITIAIENFREGEWENVITGHKDETFARTWNTRTKRVGRWVLPTSDNGLVKSVAISSCGNFGFIGSSNGGITVYNLQSGIKRKVYKFHRKAVTGIAIDSMNRKLVSCGLDGMVGFYDFSNNELLGKLQLDTPITHLVYNKNSDLVAVALDDFSISIISTLTQKIVRQLWGHSNRITALDFSHDGRWITSASLDSTIRTWDLPTGGCIDGIKLRDVATNLKFSKTGHMLATTHVAGNGIVLWTNKSQFKAVSTRQISEEEFFDLSLPSSCTKEGATLLEGAFDKDDEEAYFNSYVSADQINDDLVTLSLGPRSKFNTLLKLDIIKQRSKPKTAPKKSDNVPFFLKLSGEKIGDDACGREGIQHNYPLFNLEAQATDMKNIEAEEQLLKFKPGQATSFESQFTKSLRTCAQSEDYTDFLENLVRMSPAAIDMEIRALNAFEPFSEIIWFIDALIFGLKTNKNFELYEAFMSMLIKVHGDVLSANNKKEGIAASLNAWDRCHSQFEKLDDLVKFCSSVIGFVNTF